MEKADFLRHLDRVQKLAFQGDGLIEAQKRVVASLKAAGANTQAAQAVLDAMEETQKDQLAELEWLNEALNGMFGG
jgi:hypothetical protein